MASPWTTEQQDLKKVCPFLVEMRGVSFEAQWTILRYICKAIPKFGGVALDSDANGAWLAEQALTEFGARQVDSVSIGNSWYSENMPKLREAFEEERILIPADIDVREDFMMIEVRDGIPKMRKERGEDSKSKKPRHGDSTIALALAYARHGEAPGKIEFLPVSKVDLGRDKPRWDFSPRRHVL